SMSDMNSESKSNTVSDKMCEVHDKISAILVCAHVKGTETEKAGRSGEKYLATNCLNPGLISAIQAGARVVPTAMTDGTCCRVFNGKIQKRRDIKPGREVPEGWIQTGSDEKSGHLIGFMDLEKGDKWHYDCHVKDPSSPSGLDINKVLCITTNKAGDALVYEEVNIADLNGHTVELMGPKFQSNPHGLKAHCLMRHGTVKLTDFPDLRDYVSVDGAEPLKENALADIRNWFLNSKQGPHLEGVVLHLDNGEMYKLHRHHLDLEWSAKSARPLDQIPL
uniref:RNA ligase1 n=1 Tax=Yasminevirus sp. GU-2018 TaxID=2420051 RepID=UPI0035F21D13